MGGPQDDDGKGSNAYEVAGIREGSNPVSTLILVVVETTEGDRGELLLPDEEKPVGLGVEVADGDNDGGELVKVARENEGESDGDNDGTEFVDGDSEVDSDGKEDEDEVGSEVAAVVRAAATRMRTAEGHMNA